MKCDKAMDLIHYYHGEQAPLLVHLRVALHLLLCPRCTQKNELLETSHEILGADFLPPAPDMEESIMNKIAMEENNILDLQEEDIPLEPGELSTRGWVIAGLIILVSLASVFFGLEFNQLASAEGVSFLLPIGITIGIVLTSYGALFIGSHLKEFSKRFRL